MAAPRVSVGAAVLAVAVPLLFLHGTYQPTLSVCRRGHVDRRHARRPRDRRGRGGGDRARRARRGGAARAGAAGCWTSLAGLCAFALAVGRLRPSLRRGLRRWQARLVSRREVRVVRAARRRRPAARAHATGRGPARSAAARAGASPRRRSGRRSSSSASSTSSSGRRPGAARAVVRRHPRLRGALRARRSSSALVGLADPRATGRPRLAARPAGDRDGRARHRPLRRDDRRRSASARRASCSRSSASRRFGATRRSVARDGRDRARGRSRAPRTMRGTTRSSEFAEFLGIRDRVEDTGRSRATPTGRCSPTSALRIFLDHPIIGVGCQGSNEEWAYGPHLDGRPRALPRRARRRRSPRPSTPGACRTSTVAGRWPTGASSGFGLLLAVVAAGLAAGRCRRALERRPARRRSAGILVAAGVWNGLGRRARDPARRADLARRSAWRPS